MKLRPIHFDDSCEDQSLDGRQNREADLHYAQDSPLAHLQAHQETVVKRSDQKVIAVGCHFDAAAGHRVESGELFQHSRCRSAPSAATDKTFPLKLLLRWCPLPVVHLL